MPAPSFACDANAEEVRASATVEACSQSATEAVEACAHTEIDAAEAHSPGDPVASALNAEPSEVVSFDRLSRRAPGESVVTSALHMRTDIDMDADEPSAQASEPAVAPVAPVVPVVPPAVATPVADFVSSVAAAVVVSASAPAPAQVPPATTTSLSMMPAESNWVSEQAPLRALPDDEPASLPVDSTPLADAAAETAGDEGGRGSRRAAMESEHTEDPAVRQEPHPPIPTSRTPSEIPVEPAVEPEPGSVLIDVQTPIFSDEMTVTASEQADAFFAAELDSWAAQGFVPLTHDDLIEDDRGPVSCDDSRELASCDATAPVIPVAPVASATPAVPTAPVEAAVMPTDLVARIGQALHQRRQRKVAADRSRAEAGSLKPHVADVELKRVGDASVEPPFHLVADPQLRLGGSLALPVQAPAISDGETQAPRQPMPTSPAELLPSITAPTSVEACIAPLPVMASAGACAETSSTVVRSGSPAVQSPTSAPRSARLASPPVPALVEPAVTSSPSVLVPLLAAVAVAVGALGNAWMFSGWPLVEVMTWAMMLLLPGVVAAGLLRQCSQVAPSAAAAPVRASAAVALAVSGLGWLAWSMLAGTGGWEVWVGVLLASDAGLLATKGRGVAIDLATGRYRSWIKAAVAGFVLGLFAWLLGDARHGILGGAATGAGTWRGAGGGAGGSVGDAIEFLSAVRLGEPWQAGLRSVPMALLVAQAWMWKTLKNKREN